MGAGRDAHEFKLAFQHDLTRVADILKQLPDAVRPSLRTLARTTGFSKSTVENWLAGRSFPESIDALCVLLAEVRLAAARSGVGADEFCWLDAGRWRSSHQQVLVQRQHEAQVLQRGRQATISLDAMRSDVMRRSLRDPPRLVRSWSEEALGVHPAVAGTTDEDASFVLPTYIPRAHDHRLREALRTATAGTEVALLLVRGGSCTGKTRTMAEALHAIPQLDPWMLAKPVTTASALQLLRSGAVDQHTVLWLDDAHKLLQDATGETLAAALLSRLNSGGQGPALILATIWDDAFAELTAAPPVPSLSDDRYHDRRALLRRARCIDVPAAFTDDALRALAVAGAGDPALSTAIATAPLGKVAQTLAAALPLQDRYVSALHPPYCYARALTTAAMDAARLGWAAPLPEKFLVAAADGYLDEEQRSTAHDQWFPQALAIACEKVHRVAAALEPVPRTSGMGRQPGVWQLTDYLDHYGRSSRQRDCPPASFWDAAVTHLESAEGLMALADSAFHRWRLRHAVRLLNKAAKVGGSEPLLKLSLIAAFMGADRRATLLRAAERGSVEALWQLMDDADDETKTHVLTFLVRIGNTLAMHKLARHRQDEGDGEAAIALYQLAADAGDTDAQRIIASHYRQAGDKQREESSLRDALAAGDGYAAFPLALLLEQAGDWEGAERLLREVAHAGAPEALISLAWRHADAGAWRSVEDVLQEAAELGAAQTWLHLAEMYEQTGHTGLAMNVYRQTAENGDTDAMLMLADNLKSAGDRPQAEQWYQRAADMGNTAGLQALVLLRLGDDDIQEARRLAVLAADAGDSSSILVLTGVQDEHLRQIRAYGLEADGTPSHPWTIHAVDEAQHHRGTASNAHDSAHC